MQAACMNEFYSGKLLCQWQVFLLGERGPLNRWDAQVELPWDRVSTSWVSFSWEMGRINIFLVGALEHVLFFPSYWELHRPNCYSLHEFRGVGNRPTRHL